MTTVLLLYLSVENIFSAISYRTICAHSVRRCTLHENLDTYKCIHIPRDTSYSHTT